MPVYNSERYINEAIESILNQSFQDFEFLIIDDASTDKSVELMKVYNDPRIILFLKPVNTGYTESLNMALSMAKGKYVARMDSDDISLVTRLAQQVEFMESNKMIAGCGSAIKIIPNSEVVIYPTEPEKLKIALLDYCAIAHPSMILRKQFMIDKNLSYDKSFEPSEDYDLWTRIVEDADLANIPQILLHYRQHNNQISIVKEMLQRKNADRCRIRMLGYLHTPLSEFDIECCEVVYQRKKIRSLELLYRIVDWLDYSVIKNKTRNFYHQEMFMEFIRKKKTLLIQSFFLQRISYSPVTLSEYFFADKKIKGFLTFSNHMKLFVKSMIFRRIQLEKLME